MTLRKISKTKISVHIGGFKAKALSKLRPRRSASNDFGRAFQLLQRRDPPRILLEQDSECLQ